MHSNYVSIFYTFIVSYHSSTVSFSCTIIILQCFNFCHTIETNFLSQIFHEYRIIFSWGRIFVPQNPDVNGSFFLFVKTQCLLSVRGGLTVCGNLSTVSLLSVRGIYLLFVCTYFLFLGTYFLLSVRMLVVFYSQGLTFCSKRLTFCSGRLTVSLWIFTFFL